MGILLMSVASGHSAGKSACARGWRMGSEDQGLMADRVAIGTEGARFRLRFILAQRSMAVSIGPR
jgi:hypothetical protein